MKWSIAFILVASIALLPSCATVKISQTERDALKVLQRYLALDRSGARVDDSRYHSAAALTQWQEEPNWDIILVISGSAISRPQSNGDTTSIRVSFAVEGVIAADTFYPVTALPGELTDRVNPQEIVEFVMSPSTNGWKIASPQIAPHIGFPAARTLLTTMNAQAALQTLGDAAYVAKLKGARAGHCNCERLDF